MTLQELKLHEQGRILSIREDSLTLKLLEMGFIPGEVVTIEHLSLKKDPIGVRVSGYLIGLRRAEAALITIEKV